MMNRTNRFKKTVVGSAFWNSKKPEFLSLLLFLVSYCVITAFHEPWFDEAQSWQIAKCEGIIRLLFYIPHYEGNPSLWYLILAIPAKLGLPFELGLKSVGLVISMGSVLLLLFKSPLPRPLKLTIPFTYFYFYQYGIVVRPYGLMILAFIFLAMSFSSRNTRPWKFVLCLAFLCETSSFCVIIAGFIALCWLIEICKDTSNSYILKDKRIYALISLLIFAVILVATLIPAPDASFTSKWERNNTVFECFALGMMTFLSETLLTTSPWFSNDQTALASARIDVTSLIAATIIQLLIYILIFCFSSKKNLKYFVFPYLGFCLFAAVVFLGGHHLGIGYFTLLFWLWINCADGQQYEIARIVAMKLKIGSGSTVLLRRCVISFCSLSIGISILWTVKSSLKEIEVQYSYGRETAAFLSETGLESAMIATSWIDKVGDAGQSDYSDVDINGNGWPVPLCAYAGRNISYNFNEGLDDVAYVQFKKLTTSQIMTSIEHWRSYGIPEVLIGEVDVELLTNGGISIKDYSPVYEMTINYIWKGNIYNGMQYIFLRNDLLNTYSLTPIERPVGIYGDMSFTITDEIYKQYQNGESVDDILEPYLDYMFGKESGS